jgi:SRSO17 transposase
MKTKTSIKSNRFFHSVQGHFKKKNSSIKQIVSRIRKFVYSRQVQNQNEEKQANDCICGGQATQRSHKPKEPNKLTASIICGFDSILNGYNNFFHTGKKTQQDKAHYYLQGLFCAERGKRNIERMVEEVSGSEYESLQHFISDSPWDSAGLMLELASNISRKLQPYGKIGCTVDEKAHLKKGTKSVGVARQYAGTSGKVDNCQVGVYLSLTAGKYSSLTNYRLFLPQKWIDDPKRCEKAGVPKHKMVFKTKPQLALEMIVEHLDHGVHFDYVNGDGLYGNGFEFSKGLTARGVKYVLETHCDQTIFIEKPLISVPVNEPGKRGRQHSLPVSDQSGIRVEEYARRLHKKEFTEVRIRRTTKGWLTALVHVAPIWVWDKKAADLNPIQQTLIIRKPMSKADKTKYSLSNIAIEEQSLEEFAFMQAQRFWIERCFRDDSHDLGMSDYQVRTFRGFNNHMALTCVAMEYILTERLKNSLDVPLLSTNDIRLLIAREIRSAEEYDCDDQRIQQLQKRHRQRQKDIDRSYEFNLPK